MLPSGILFIILFAIPTIIALFFSLTRWDLQTWKFIGLENFQTWFSNPNLTIGFRNTIIYGVATSALKVVLGLYLANFLTSRIRTKGFLRAVIFFPTLISSVGIGILFKVLLNPFGGPFDATISHFLLHFGIHTRGPGWLSDPNLLPLISIALVDVWKGVGFATIIYIAGIVSIPGEFYEAAAIDGASGRKVFRKITVPLLKPAMGAVIILSFIAGLRSFDLIWAMTGGGPGFASDVLASINYKQYAAGFYGISTAGNIILLVVVTGLVYPLSRYLNRSEEN